MKRIPGADIHPRMFAQLICFFLCFSIFGEDTYEIKESREERENEFSGGFWGSEQSEERTHINPRLYLADNFSRISPLSSTPIT